MTRNQFKNYLDFIPLIILTVSAGILSWTVASNEIVFLWKHILGLSFIPIIILAFRWQHKIGVLTLGLTLLIGLLGLISYSPAVTTTTGTIGKDADSQIPIFYGQPIFLLWLLIHLLVSGRHYVGILTKKYWQDLFDKSVVKTSA